MASRKRHYVTARHNAGVDWQAQARADEAYRKALRGPAFTLGPFSVCPLDAGRAEYAVSIKQEAALRLNLWPHGTAPLIAKVQAAAV